MTRDELALKLDVVREYLGRLDELAAIGDFETFSQDFRNLDSALHRLQVTIQAVIDVGAMLIARLALPTPSTSRGVFEVLEQHGHLPPGTAARLRPVVGFRNRVVHLYDRVDPRIVHRILLDNRADLARVLAELLRGFDDLG